MEKYVLLGACLITFLCIFIIMGLNVALPTIAQEFGMNNFIQNWSSTIFFVSVAAFTIPIAQICGKYGCRKVFFAGTCIYAIGIVLTCLANSAEAYLISRALQGLGYAVYNVALMSLLMLVVDENRRGRAMGTCIFVSYVGYIITPAISGYIINNFGWRFIGYIGIVSIILIILLCTVLIRGEWKDDRVEKLDYVGALLFIAGLFPITYGISDLLSPIGMVSIVIGIIILTLFGIYEFRTDDPIFNIGLFKNRTFLAYVITGFFFFFACYAYDALFNYQLQYVNGLNPEYAGMLLIIFPLFMAISTPIAGRIADKVHPQKFSTTGLVLLAVAFVFIYIFFGKGASIYAVATAMILLAISVGLFSVPNITAIMGSVSEENIPQATASEITLRSIGQSLSYSLLTLVFAMVAGSAALSTQNADMVVSSTKTISIISIVLTVVAILISLYGIKSEKAN